MWKKRKCQLRWIFFAFHSFIHSFIHPSIPLPEVTTEDVVCLFFVLSLLSLFLSGKKEPLSFFLFEQKKVTDWRHNFEGKNGLEH